MTPESKPAVTIGHVGLCVPDIARAIDWYTDVLSLDLMAGPMELNVESVSGPALRDVFGPDFRRALIAHLGSGGEAGLELFQFIEPSAAEVGEASYFRFGPSHLCFVCDDLEEMTTKIERGGGKVRTEIWREDQNLPYRYVHFEDPFGNLLELHSHPYREAMSRLGGGLAS